MEKTKSIFLETFGEAPKIKVLDFFLTFAEFDYSKSQVARETGVSRITIEPIWHELEDEGIIVKTRQIGRAMLCRLNRENPTAKALLEFSLRLASVYAEGEHEKIRVKVRAKQ
ncbi:Uncharacterised protein [uncultured archaeon]|nr:Uncharacterised protein [uncultured archaeon]